MITKLRVSNYKSIGRIDVELGAFTTLVGPNGSGKSNVADVLRFFADCLNTSLAQAIAVRHGFRAIRRWDSNGSHAVDIGITVRTEEGSGLWRFTLASTEVEYGFRVEREYALWSPKAPADAWDLDDPDGQIRRVRDPNDETWRFSDTAWLQRDHSRQYNAGIGGRSIGFVPVVEALDETQLALPHCLTNYRKELAPLKEELRRMAIYNPFPNTLREAQNPNPIPPMAAAGDDWASKLKSLNKATWGMELLAALHRIVGDIDDYRVQDAGTFLIPEFRHGTNPQGRERWLGAAQESDGTLRLAAILTGLFQEPTLSLIGFEEPELAVHPGAIPILFDFLKEASTRSQVLLTTHSPDLLDLLPIDDVRVVERHDGATTVSRVEERQRELVKKRLISTSDLLHAEGLHSESTTTDG
jgi:predicted ATPase